MSIEAVTLSEELKMEGERFSELEIYDKVLTLSRDDTYRVYDVTTSFQKQLLWQAHLNLMMQNEQLTKNKDVSLHSLKITFRSCLTKTTLIGSEIKLLNLK